VNEKSSWRQSLVHPATMLSGLALIVAMSGTAVAAGLVTGGDVKNGSLTGKDVKDRSLTKVDFKGSVQGPRGAEGRRGPQGVAGAAGSAVAYAHINNDGTLDADRSKNITAVERDAVLTNYHCVNVSVPVEHAVAALDGTGAGQIVITAGDPFTACSVGGSDFAIQTFNGTGAASPRGFWITFN
jgi:hypothetical protein